MNGLSAIALSASFLSAACLLQPQECPSIPRLPAPEASPMLQLNLSKESVAAGGEEGIEVVLDPREDMENYQLTVMISCNMDYPNFQKSVRRSIKPDQENFTFTASVPGDLFHERTCSVEAKLTPNEKYERRIYSVEEWFQVTPGSNPSVGPRGPNERRFPLALRLNSVKKAEVSNRQIVSVHDARQDIQQLAIQLDQLICEDRVTFADIIYVRRHANAILDRTLNSLLGNAQGDSEDQPRQIREFIGDLKERMRELDLKQEVGHLAWGSYVLLTALDPQTANSHDRNANLSAPQLLAVLFQIWKALYNVESTGSLVYDLKIESCPEGATVSYYLNGEKDKERAATNTTIYRLVKARINFDFALEVGPKRVRKTTFQQDFIHSPFTHVRVFCKPPPVTDEANIDWEPE